MDEEPRSFVIGDRIKIAVPSKYELIDGEVTELWVVLNRRGGQKTMRLKSGDHVGFKIREK